MAGCEDGTVIRLAIFNLQYTMAVFEPLCPTRIKPVCDPEQEMTGCNLDQIEVCLEHIKVVEKDEKCMYV